MINFTIHTNGDSSQLVIELLEDAVYIEPGTVAYVVGNITNDPSKDTASTRFLAYYLGRRFFKQSFKGTGKLYLKPSLGTYHKINLKSEEPIVLGSNVFIACPDSIKINPQIKPSLAKFLSGTPMINAIAQGEGTLVMLMPGPAVELKLKNDKFVAYTSNIGCYTSSLSVTRQPSEPGWMNIANSMVKVYRGTGSLFFSPHPNKDYKVGFK